MKPGDYTSLIVTTTFAAVSSLLVVGTSAQSLAPPQVSLGYSTYQGFFNTSCNVTTFLGLRFAAPPTNELRWRAPQAPPFTPGVQSATTQPPECYQATVGLAPSNPFATTPRRDAGNPDITEDCLFLNVYVPNQLDPSKKYPVVVWIHGGGYDQGRASIFHGEDLVVGADHSIISVVIQYRLGLFGFLSSSQIKSNGDLNVGLLDQEFALKWVQQYIAKFGGDPTQVTIWGESAGAGGVLQQVVAHGGNTQPPLFRAAMTSSTYLYAQYNYNHHIPETLFAQVVNGTGCSNASDKISCLRTADVSLLDAANRQISAGSLFGTYSFLPVVDGSFIVERPTRTLQKGHGNGQVLFSMLNTNEGVVFVNPPFITNLRDYVVQLFPIAPTPIINAITKQYQQLPGAPADQAAAVIGESSFICATYFLLKAFSGRAWKGEFALPPAHHEMDVQYYFTSYVPFLPAPPAYNNTDWRKAFAQSFFSTIKSLDPNVKFDPTNIRPPWPKWTLSDPTEMLFNKTETDQPVIQTKPTGPLLDRCNFWESIAQYIAY